MDVCHLLLRRPWQYDKHVIYDGFKNTYAFNMDGHKIVLAPLKSMMSLESKKDEGSILLSKVELDKKVKGGCDVLIFVVVEENEEINELSDVVRPMLME